MTDLVRYSFMIWVGSPREPPVQKIFNFLNQDKEKCHTFFGGTNGQRPFLNTKILKKSKDVIQRKIDDYEIY